MKMILMMADASRLDSVRGDLAGLGVSGYTLLPVLEGQGRTGLHSGDRVHPGALATVIAVVEDALAEAVFDGLAARRDRDGDSVSRLFLLPVERQR